MNILREIRRINKRSMPARISLILLFSVILIMSTFAWFSAQKDVNIKGLEGAVTSWDVAYFVNNDENQILDETATFTIDELYPGMPDREDVVHIYNIGQASTDITYELVSVKVFGREVLSQLQTSGEIQTNTATNTTNIFSKDTQYPFNISYTYDKDYLNGKYAEDDLVTSQTAHAIFKFNVSWAYNVANGTDEQNIAKDILDTKFGKDAYAYYQNAENDPSKAIEVQVRITSSMIHPSLES